jgi:hypothetical protein
MGREREQSGCDCKSAQKGTKTRERYLCIQNELNDPLETQSVWQTFRGFFLVRVTERSASPYRRKAYCFGHFPSFMFSETAILFCYFRPAFASQNGTPGYVVRLRLRRKISDSRLVGWCKNWAECCCLPLWIARVGWLAIGPLVARLGTFLSYKDSKKIPTDRLGVTLHTLQQQLSSSSLSSSSSW